MFSDAPPCSLAVTTSRTCREEVEVKTFTNSGMMAPASVPHVMMEASLHHIVLSPPRFGMSRYDAAYVRTTETIDVSHTRLVSGFSKSMWFAFAYLALAIPSLMK